MNTKVLIIDDEEDLARITSKWIRSGGYDVVCYHEGKGAVEKVKELKPHIILLDIILPDVSGIEICKVLQQDEQLKEIPILFFTSSRPGETLAFASLGPQGVVYKPYEPHDFLMSIKKTLTNFAEM